MLPINPHLRKIYDLARATSIARLCELNFGFGVAMDQVYFDALGGPVPTEVVACIRRRLADGIARASAILIEHRDFLSAVAAALFRTGFLDRDEIDAIGKRYGR